MALSPKKVKSLFAEANESADSFGAELPPGSYVMKVVAFSSRNAQSSGASMISQEYEVVEGDLKGRKHWENSVLEHKVGLSILFQRLRAMGYDTDISSMEGLMEIIDHVNSRKPTLEVKLVKKGSGDKARIYFNITAVVEDESAEEDTAGGSVPEEPQEEPETSTPPADDVDEEEEDEEEGVVLEKGMLVKFSWKTKTFRGEVTAIDESTGKITVLSPKGNKYVVVADAIKEVYQQ